MLARVHDVRDAQGFALRTMGQVARGTSDLPTVKEWVSLLVANRSLRRDDVSALRAIYDAVLGRWAYVRESDEWIPGDPERLLGYVAGIKYNTRQPVLTARIADVPSRILGWGDCDDISTLVAALARAAGLTPYFRVSKWTGGAHVSVVVVTPNGQNVSLDPVGHPDHEFGWRLRAPHVAYYDLNGRRVPLGDDSGSSMQTQYNLSGFGCCGSAAAPCHVVILARGAPDGPRSLATDERAAKLAARGVVLDGTPAWDQYGAAYEYCANRDVWAPFGGIRSRRRARRRRRRAKRRRVIARTVRNVGAGARRAIASPAIRSLVAAGGQAVGIPAPATAAALRAASNVVERKGRRSIARSFARSPRKTAAAVARAAPAFRATVSSGMGASPPAYQIAQGGCVYRGAPVVAMSGIPGAVYMGDITVSSAPKPGSWYRIQPGDALLKVAGRAFGLGAGGARYRAAKMINDAPANAPYFEPDNIDNLFKSGKISFSPKWSSDPAAAIKGGRGDSFAVIWIPAAEGDSPPETPEDSGEAEADTPDETPEVEETVPDVPEIPDVEPETEKPEVEPEITPDEDSGEVETLPDTPEVDPVDPGDGETIPPIEPEIPDVEPDTADEADDLNQDASGMGTGAILLALAGGIAGYALLKRKKGRR